MSSIISVKTIKTYPKSFDVKTKKILLEEIEDFYKNYKDYVTTIR